MTEEEYREFLRRNSIKPAEKPRRTSGTRAMLEGTAEAPKRSKYGNRKTEVDGILFDSQHEANMYAEMDLEVKAGKYRALLCQVTFLLPGGVAYRADFVTLNTDGTYTVYDAKSAATRKDKVYRLKKRLMKNCLGIDIVEV